MNRVLGLCLYGVGITLLHLAGEVIAGEKGPLEIALWEGTPPGSERFTGQAKYDNRNSAPPDRWLTGVGKPVLTVYPPEDESSRAAVVVFPGGGYRGQAIDKEGHDIARWLARRGVLAVVVPYRCGGGVHQHPVPLSDAQRAVQLVRSRSDEWDIDPDKIGVMGFSAGGHLAATAATQWLEGETTSDEWLRHLSSRPDFAVLVYPVISMREGVTHGGSRLNLLGDSPSEELVANMSADERITADTPPTLIIHSVDDKVVPVENAQRFYDSCRRHGVPCEMHLYETGGHGYGMKIKEGTVANWPDVLEDWMVARGLAARLP